MRRHGIAVIVLALVAVAACSRNDTTFSESGLPDVRFFGASGSGSTVRFLSDDAMATADRIAQGPLEGTVGRIDYDVRGPDDNLADVWQDLSLMRATSYADAVRMLRQNGVTDELMVSASMVDGYLKYWNDELYAAAERVLSAEIPGYPGQNRSTLSAALLAGLDDSGAAGLENVRDVLVDNAAIFEMPASQFEAFWKTDPFQFKPLSFYDQDEELQRTWLADRVLLKAIPGTPAVAEAFNSWFEGWSDEEAKGAFLAFRGFFGKLTNRVDPALFDDRPLSSLVNERRIGYQDPSLYLWPPSSPGTLERLPGNERDQCDASATAQPDMQTTIDAIKSGEVTFEPQDDEGFFIHQRWSLQALLTFGDLPESSKVLPSDAILQTWEEAFKAGMAKALETHQKLIDAGGAAVSATIEPEERMLVEPIPTLYQRYASQYRFLRTWIESLPASFTDRWTIGDEKARDLVERLEREMLGLYLISTRQLRMTASAEASDHIDLFSENAAVTAGVALLQRLPQEPAMGSDQRIIAVQGRPGGPEDRGCEDKPATFWATIGVRAVPVKMTGGPMIPDAVVLVDNFVEMKACVGEPPNRLEWREVLSASKDTQDLLYRFLDTF